MPQTSFTTEILASQESVWEIMTDHQRYSKWSPAKKVSLEKEGTPEKNGKGAIRVFHSVVKTREEVIKWDQPNSMTYRLLVDWPIKNYQATMELTSDSGTTQLVWNSEWENRLPKFLSGIPAKIMKKALKGFAKGIKIDAENTPTI